MKPAKPLACEFSQSPRAVSEASLADIRGVQNAQEEVRHGRTRPGVIWAAFQVVDMSTRREGASAAAGHEHRQVHMAVTVAIFYLTGEIEDAIVQQCAVQVINNKFPSLLREHCGGSTGIGQALPH